MSLGVAGGKCSLYLYKYIYNIYILLMQYTVCIYVCACGCVDLHTHTCKQFLEENSECFASETLWCANLELNRKKAIYLKAA